MDIRGIVSHWLHEQGLRSTDELSETDYDKVRVLLGTDRPSFGILWSMIMFERQRCAMSLANADLGTDVGRAAASRLQGMVLMVDSIREIILNIADPEAEGSAPPVTVAGVRFDG